MVGEESGALWRDNMTLWRARLTGEYLNPFIQARHRAFNKTFSAGRAASLPCRVLLEASNDIQLMR